MTRFVSASEVSAMLADRREIAFLDMREIVPFGSGHPLLATNLPLSRMEPSIGRLVPRNTTRIVLTDGGGGHAALATERLGPMGYTDVAVVDGGAAAWAAAGEALFPEIEVPAKGFGAFAERFGRPEFISPPALDRALRSGEDWIVLDSRPRAEYRNGNIPGSIDAPGADVVRCFDDLVPSASTKVVVNCMSATRGILGGLSLMAAGVPNDVYVLHHGTRGWLLDGYALETDASRFPGPPSSAAIDSARVRVARIAERAGLRCIDRKTLERWRGEADRTTYLFDVRTTEEYAAGHLDGSRNAPEGTIVMNSGHYFATLNARIVLVDDDTVRATVTALWLSQMGWGEVAVLVDGLEGGSLETGPEPTRDIGLDLAPIRELAAREVETLCVEQPVRIIDVGASDSYVDGHVPAAVWCSRVALGALLGGEAHDGPTVLTSEDGVLARLAANDLDEASLKDVSILAGGNGAWRAAGLALSTGAARLVSPRDDHWLRASERPGETRRNVIDYLEWEVTLLDDIERGGNVPYRNLIWH
jgi:rhodanese-related sulfurtransferase